jgi:hypothetical protein
MPATDFIRHVLNANPNVANSVDPEIAKCWIKLTADALHRHRAAFDCIADRLPVSSPWTAYSTVVGRLLDHSNLSWQRIVVVLAFAVYVQERFVGCNVENETVALVERRLTNWVREPFCLGQQLLCDIDWSTHCTSVLLHCVETDRRPPQLHISNYTDDDDDDDGFDNNENRPRCTDAERDRPGFDSSTGRCSARATHQVSYV